MPLARAARRGSPHISTFARSMWLPTGLRLFGQIADEISRRAVRLLDVVALVAVLTAWNSWCLGAAIPRREPPRLDRT